MKSLTVWVWFRGDEAPVVAYENAFANCNGGFLQVIYQDGKKVIGFPMDLVAKYEASATESKAVEDGS